MKKSIILNDRVIAIIEIFKDFDRNSKSFISLDQAITNQAKIVGDIYNKTQEELEQIQEELNSFDNTLIDVVQVVQSITFFDIVVGKTAISINISKEELEKLNREIEMIEKIGITMTYAQAKEERIGLSGKALEAYEVFKTGRDFFKDLRENFFKS